MKPFVLLFLQLLFTKPALYASSYQDQLMMELITAEPGSVIQMPEGFFEIDTQLSLTTNQVTLKGHGPNKTILSFKKQTEGAEGLLVTGNKVVLEDFQIQDTKGDGIKITRSNGVILRNLRVDWTQGPLTTNGAYGLYPVQSKNILIESCVVSGASDSGIYVGQSSNVIIRRNEAYNNVAGIEVENSISVDVYNNFTHGNTGGILVFNLPDLNQKGEQTRVFNNTIVSNNTINFAPPSNTVADVPTGTGIMITANHKVEIFENYIKGNQTAGLIIASYLLTQRPINDATYDPYVEGLFAYKNTFINNGFDPKGGSSTTTKKMIGFLKEILGTPFPDTIFDGSINPIYESKPLPADRRICLTNNHNMSFVNLDYTNDLAKLSTDLTPHSCTLQKLPQIEL